LHDAWRRSMVDYRARKPSSRTPFNAGRSDRTATQPCSPKSGKRDWSDLVPCPRSVATESPFHWGPNTEQEGTANRAGMTRRKAAPQPCVTLAHARLAHRTPDRRPRYVAAGLRQPRARTEAAWRYRDAGPSSLGRSAVHRGTCLLRHSRRRKQIPDVHARTGVVIVDAGTSQQSARHHPQRG